MLKVKLLVLLILGMFAMMLWVSYDTGYRSGLHEGLQEGATREGLKAYAAGYRACTQKADY